MKRKLHTLTFVAALSLILAVCCWAQMSAIRSGDTVPAAPDYPSVDFSDAEVWDVMRVVVSDTLIVRQAQK